MHFSLFSYVSYYWEKNALIVIRIFFFFNHLQYLVR